MKTNLFVAVLLVAAGTASAQNAIVNSRPGTFVEISGLSGVHPLINGLRQDDTSFAFTSTVTNAVFASTNVRVCTNGYIQFGAATGATDWTNATIVTPGTNSPIAPNNAQALFPFWDDQLFVASGTGEIYWIEAPAASLGLPAGLGNVLVIEWSNAPHYNLGNPQGAATYQVQIYQNVVNGVAAQMIYSDTVYEDASMDNGVSATVGFAAGTTGGAASLNNALWSFNTAGGVTSGTVLSVLVPTATTNPTVTGTFSGPTPGAPIGAGDTVLFTATPVGGLNPSSTGLAVRGDLTPIGGPSNAVFHDDGSNGDVTQGDGVFSYSYLIPPNTPGGSVNITLTVTDAQSRSGTGTVVAALTADLGQIGAGAGGSEVVTTHDTPIVSGGITWLSFSLGSDVMDGNGVYLDIDTESANGDGAPAVGSINDTELGLYTSDGTFVATDDDDGSDWHTQLSFGDTSSPRSPFGNGTAGNGRDGGLSAGSFYLACGCYNSVFNPGFGASSTSTAAGTIQVNFRTNVPGGGTGGQCSVADVGIAGGLAGHDHLLDNNDFIAFITLFFDNDPQADMGIAGGLPGSDNQWDNNDFIAFIGHFFDDAVACNG